MKKFILIILILPLGVPAQISNGDFEMWSDSLNNSVYTANLPPYNPQWSQTTPDNWTQSGLQCRIDDSHTGNYGMLCYTFYNYVAGWISYMDYSGSRPDMLEGYYKYELRDAHYDYALRYASVTAWSNGDTIGTSFFEFDTVSTYTHFSSPITFTSNTTPDSLNIYFHTNGVGSSAIVSGLLFLDDIEFGYNSTGLENQNELEKFKISPNPTQNNLSIQFDHLKYVDYEIFSLNGELVKTGRLMGNESSLSLERINSGIYILKLINEFRESQVKIMKE